MFPNNDWNKNSRNILCLDMKPFLNQQISNKKAAIGTEGLTEAIIIEIKNLRRSFLEWVGEHVRIAQKNNEILI